ncbi:Uncharacterized protein FWK35_00016638 [Aphis craccivora]|uniref:Uncharacterized protein n=1 Tax=Aphis craccivora TaxID=307492 RepID=A0A6G0ZIS9_APHCR|nr:Uncharacterized protein FWK35_00016638 [Aphis craccivora]
MEDIMNGVAILLYEAQRRRVENGILLTLCVVGLSEFVCVCVSRARVCVFFSSTFLHIPTPYVVRAVRAVVVVVVVDDAAAADNEAEGVSNSWKVSAVSLSEKKKRNETK